MLHMMRARGGGKTQAMRETGVPMMLANGGVVNATKKAGRWSAISHARELHAPPVHPGATHDHASKNPVHPGDETHTTTHTDDATTCNCVTCNGCRRLQEPEAA